MPVTTSHHFLSQTASTVDQAEIDHFASLAKEWWNPEGKFKPLHKFNPVRLAYIREQLCAHFNRDIKAPDAFNGLHILDIGCGGGLLSAPMAKMGANVVGADAGAVNIEVAKIHAAENNLNIDYRATTAEDLAATGTQFDVVLAMEVIEHVADVPLFLNACAQMVRPGGLILLATINRTLKARAFAIFMAEQILRWLPKGTHQYEKLVKPVEISGPLILNGLEIIDQLGVSYDPLKDQWQRTKDMSVNYMMLAQRPDHGTPPAAHTV